MGVPLFTEDHVSQVPALQLLINMGYEYIPPKRANELRGNKTSVVLFEEILKAQLEKINSFTTLGNEYKFSQGNINSAILEVRDLPIQEGFINANQYLYDLLLIGKSYEENVEGNKKSHHIRYIDWENPKNNVFHVTEEYSVLRDGSSSHYRPDLVLFINGIPIVVIECKSPSINGNKTPNELAQEQHLRNQTIDGIRSLYVYSQLLLSIASDQQCSYATTGTQKEFWSGWKEQFRSGRNQIGISEEEYKLVLGRLKNQALSDSQKLDLFSDRYSYVKSYFNGLEEETRPITAQDELLFNLCSHERLLDLIKNFILFDDGIKKVARYQQYFAIKNTLKRISVLDNTGRREGGVIWHTQGSGKSLTMVMMAQMIAKSEIKNPKIILVTDRIDLDKQISETFKKCQKDVVRASTGVELTNLIQSKRNAVITTVINKFEAAVNKIKYPLDSTEIFVMVDEGHRSQYGTFNTSMERVFPNACFIAFTGTPLMKKEKKTADKFGGYIGIPYTVVNAVEDGAIVPLLYEGRHNQFSLNEEPINRHFDRVTEPLTEYGKTELKKKFNTKSQLQRAEQIVYERASDISQHYVDFFQTKDTDYKPKAQLVAPSIKTALLYKKYLDEIGKVKSDVIVTRSDQREGVEDVFYNSNEDKKFEEEYFKAMNDKYGSLEKFEEEVIKQFKGPDDPEILIVVAKLLTGFDAPRNTILYLCKPLKEHTLLQGIARVNRKFKGKEFGYIIDYVGVLEELHEAIKTYSDFGDFNGKDLEGTFTEINEEIKKMPQAHSELWDIFKELKGRNFEASAYERLLAPEDIRNIFYEKLSVFCRLLKMALSSVQFMTSTDKTKIDKYKQDAKFFLQLRVDVKRRYNDSISFKEFESQIQNLINKHITNEGEILSITEEIDVFNEEEREEELAKITDIGGKADFKLRTMIKRTNIKMEEDPIFYKKFAELIKDTIEKYYLQRITEVQYLNEAIVLEKKLENRSTINVPERLIGNKVAIAFYNQSKALLNNFELDTDEFHTDVSLIVDETINEIINKNNLMIVDWINNSEIINKIKLDAADKIFDIHEKYKLDANWDIIDELVLECLKIAKFKYKEQV